MYHSKHFLILNQENGKQNHPAIDLLLWTQNILLLCTVSTWLVFVAPKIQYETLFSSTIDNARVSIVYCCNLMHVTLLLDS